jgi:hypothetical protein
MHPLGSLIVELETARRSLQKVFELPNGPTPSERKTDRIFNGRSQKKALRRSSQETEDSACNIACLLRRDPERLENARNAVVDILV